MIDPNIPLSVRPAQFQSPIEAFTAVAQLQAVREQAEARRLAGEEARTKAARQQQTEDAYQRFVKVDPTTGKVTVDRAGLFANVHPSLIPALMKQVDEDETRVAGMQETALKLAKQKQEFLGSAARTVVAAQGDPTIWSVELTGAHKMQLIDDDTYAQLRTLTDPAQILAVAKRYVERAGGEPAKPQLITTVDAQGNEVQQFVTPQAGVSYPTVPKAAAVPTLGSFEDYVVRRFGPTPTPEQITLARKDYQQADDRPRITVNAGGGQRPITQTAEANLVSRLNSQWTAATKPARELTQQLATMRLGLAAAERGDMAQGTEAVLQPFLKILDPNSVVREGEFFRLREGQSYVARAQGIMQRLTQGGFVPLAELKKYAALAEEIAKRQDSYVAGVRGRIGTVAERYHIPEELVFETAAPPADDRTTTTTTAPREGEQRPIPNEPGGVAEYRGGRWIRVK